MYFQFKQFKKIILNYPNSKYAEDSKFKLDLIQDQLAGKEMYIARYYIEREKWGPALVRLNKVLKYHETTVYIKEALHKLVEINNKLGIIIELLQKKKKNENGYITTKIRKGKQIVRFRIVIRGKAHEKEWAVGRKRTY